MSTSETVIQSPPRVYLGALDGVRALAVCGVLLFHLAPKIGPAGFIGVDMFFTLSGFLITWILFQEWSASASIDRRAFYIRRFLRLYPALVAACILAAGAYAAEGNLSRFPAAVISSLSYTTNLVDIAGGLPTGALSHTWSLAVEEQFYLVWAVVIVFVFRLKTAAGRRSALVLGVAASILVRAGLAKTNAVSESNIYHLPTSYVDLLLIGALCALYLPELRRSRLVERFMPALAAAATLTLTLVFFLAPGIGDSKWSYGGYTAVALATAAIIVHAATGQSALLRQLASTPVRWVGRRSYGIYLYHYPLFVVMRSTGASEAVVALATLASTAIVAGASFEWLETPFLRTKDRYERV